MQREHTKQFFPLPDIIPGLACMLVMVQAYLVAPLSPALEKEFSSALVSLAVPAFAIPFAITAGGMVFLKARINLRKWFLFSLAALYLGCYLLSITTSASMFLINRIATGFGTGAMVPAALLLTTRSFEKKEPLNYMLLIIFALATGMTFGPSLGGWLNSLIGWRCLYRLSGMIAALLFFIYFLNGNPNKDQMFASSEMKNQALSMPDWKSIYLYSFVYLTGVVHSGVFVWISFYFNTQYKVDEFRFATELFIFGLPGFLVTLLMHHFHLGKKVVMILHGALGLTVAGLLLLTGNLPLWLAELLLAIMSIGFACSQPLFIGILKLPPRGVSQLKLVARGSGFLFAGYGSGPLMMLSLLTLGVNTALCVLILMVAALACVSVKVWNVKGHQAVPF
jgi:predicted MFS family arabinose efflux permease